jgi:hypothetical protein
MKHLKLFENNNNKIHLVVEYDTTINHRFAFYDIESRDNFLINYIHKRYDEDFDDDFYEDIENEFSVDKLLEEFNTDENYIELFTVEIQENIKLDPKLQLRKDKLEYNL